MKPHAFLFAALCLTPLARGDVKLPALFSEHAVLQAATKVPVWGWASPGEKITVQVAGESASATADAKGKWRVDLPKMKPGGPHELVVKGANEIKVPDVLIGEVWLGSGQSNMAMVVAKSQNFEAEKAAAELPQIRVFTVTSSGAPTAQEDCTGKWLVCGPKNIEVFSATLFFFGREIHRQLGVPVGLINSSVGGTPIESWIAPEVQRAAPELQAFFDSVKKADAITNPRAAEAVQAKYARAVAKWEQAVKTAKAEKKPLPRKPRDPSDMKARKGNVGGLFNGKIAPLIPYAMRGALWYQGEANSVPAKAPYYQPQLALLVKDWRARWGYEFPMAWAQLPNFDGVGRDWPTVREAMLKTLALPKTGMGINIDIGDAKDIHPKNKQEVGRRLSLWALGTVYGQKVATSGPLPAGHQVRGAEIVLSFQHTDGGLVAKGGDLKGFVIAGADQQWKPAQARIDGDKVIVTSADVKEPVAARYAWENNPVCNLTNGAGLPASPFRTDDWK